MHDVSIFYRKVVFDRDLLITHMVSPEGESLQLVEKIDPKGQNVEAWMLELEGKMRLTVRFGGYHKNIWCLMTVLPSDKGIAVRL